MSTLRDEEIALATPLHAHGPAYAAELSRLTGSLWRYIGTLTNDEGYANLSYCLERSDTEEPCQRVWIALDRHTKRVSCSPSWIKMPDGTEHGRRANLRDFLNYEQRKHDKPLDAGVSFDRYQNTIGAVAKRFHKDVLAPLASYWPQVTKQIADAHAAFNKQAATAERLATQYGGQISEHRNDTLYVYFRDSPLPTLRIGSSGTITLDYNPTLTEAELNALFAVRLANTKKESAE